MKSINEIQHNYRYQWAGIGSRHQWIEIDQHNSLWNGSHFAKIHMDRNDRPYIWFKRTTYYL